MEAFLTEYNLSILNLLILGLFAFFAGFIDAVVGGGGLIQLPALLIQFPQTTIATLFGTNKIAAFSGTLTSAIQYGKRIKFDLKLIGTIGLFAAGFSYLGAKLVSRVNVTLLKPFILIILVLILVYTVLKKNLGNSAARVVQPKLQYIYGSLLASLLGFYDGFFGPGTGSFFVLGFVLFLGFDFLNASAYAKVVNSITNISALLVFLLQGNFIFSIALIMAFFNIIGNIIGTHMAFKKGNAFIRLIFILVVSLLILRYSYDVFK